MVQKLFDFPSGSLFKLTFHHPFPIKHLPKLQIHSVFIPITRSECSWEGIHLKIHNYFSEFHCLPYEVFMSTEEFMILRVCEVLDNRRVRTKERGVCWEHQVETMDELSSFRFIGLALWSLRRDGLSNGSRTKDLGEKLLGLPFERDAKTSTWEDLRQVDRIVCQRTNATGHCCPRFNRPAATQIIFCSEENSCNSAARRRL